jgi:hypothetical protein
MNYLVISPIPPYPMPDFWDPESETFGYGFAM